ncbi:MAG: CBASS cGAMP-activated phospholipase [Pseudomonadota bacterium]|nr:CBASS cGAMP-activated phospholipase [Pseudomonadota bacterium]
MTFKILALSGGGFLGLYTASVLAGLEDHFGGPIAAKFDLLAGTSVGGIIALGLAAEKPASEIKKAFEVHGEEIFSNRPRPKRGLEKIFDLSRSFKKSKYSGVGLRKAVVDVVGEEMLIGDLFHPVVVPTVNLTKGQPQIFKTPHHINFRTDFRRKVVDVAMATSAAPTYFPIAEIGDELFTDGGLYANAPDQVAVHEAEHFFDRNTQDIHVLSIGSTTTQFSMSHVTNRSLGVAGWGPNLASTIISSQQMISDYMLKHRLGDRYIRIDTIQSAVQEQDLGLDVATENAKKTIRGLADGSVQNWVTDSKLRELMADLAEPPLFFYGKHAQPRDEDN